MSYMCMFFFEPVAETVRRCCLSFSNRQYESITIGRHAFWASPHVTKLCSLCLSYKVRLCFHQAVDENDSGMFDAPPIQ